MSQHLDSLSLAETSTPAIESWKWAPEDVGVVRIDEERGKSVRERVRELDRAIDYGMSLENSAKQERKDFRFGGWS